MKNLDGDSKEEEPLDNTNEEDMVPVRDHVRRSPAPTLVLSVDVLRPSPFDEIETC